MQFFPAALQNLADQFARLPGIGGKTAQRLAFHVLSLPMEDAEEFAGAMLNRPVRIQLVDLTAKPAGNPRMDQLMKFGRDHSDIIRIKNN